jgi:hypothetical protein
MFHTERLRSTAALTPAHSAETISDMIVVLEYGAEKSSEVLFCKPNSVHHHGY